MSGHAGFSPSGATLLSILSLSQLLGGGAGRSEQATGGAERGGRRRPEQSGTAAQARSKAAEDDDSADAVDNTKSGFFGTQSSSSRLAARPVPVPAAP
ncbi:Os06g0575600 [Oryza sativa Japonica Group]|uniref:Os06g0575600 protein n=1 Tax=Oryza sativa subsp. japonica TaxID=39947 RepID=A0A0P0WY37_ORYSJ|nr:Os06g0575600 [Oryza sativa Japonica Group]